MGRDEKSPKGKFTGKQKGEKSNKPTSRDKFPVKKQTASKTPVKKQTGEKTSEKKPAVSKAEGIRLNKYIANSGACSRRDADIYIGAGNVTVNGKTITEMGYRVKLTDEVKFDGHKVIPEKPEYILLNKPRGFYTTGSTERTSKTVMDLIANATKSKVAPVGKLDRQASGLLLFTNDGALEKQLGKPKNGIRQIYHIELTKPLAYEDFKKISEGVLLEDGKVNIQDISYLDNRPKNEIGLETNSVKLHVVQRLFKRMGYEIEKLDRVVYGGLTKKDLPRGNWRPLTKQEIINIKML